MSLIRHRFIPFLLVALLVITCWSCRKEDFINSPGARLSTSIDTLRFDTVFTSVGSVTKLVKINNLNNQKLRLSSVALAGGAGSAFRLNINGSPTPELRDIEVAANDSIYLFVSVRIDPTLTNLPFIVQDSVRIQFNGNTRYIQLEAFGQNANFLRHQVIRNNTTFTNNLPYVILGSLRVDTTATLTIQPGTRIYVHANAPILVDGSLRALGTAAEPIAFTGDRLDPDYRDLPASWPGIYLRNTSRQNQFQYTQVRNAFQAVVVEGPAAGGAVKLRMEQCIIDNAFESGLTGINTRIEAVNCLFSNCGRNVNLGLGGVYDFTHCTMAAYSTLIPHRNPVFRLTNFALAGTTILTAPTTATLTNCIMWGESGLVQDELVLERTGNAPFDVTIDHCLYRASADPIPATILSPIRNVDPSFDSVNTFRRVFDFRFTKNVLAPGSEAGRNTPVNLDLDGRARPNGIPEIGCYENN
jgi:hypothetical protein